MIRWTTRYPPNTMPVREWSRLRRKGRTVEAGMFPGFVACGSVALDKVFPFRTLERRIIGEASRHANAGGGVTWGIADPCDEDSSVRVGRAIEGQARQMYVGIFPSVNRR